SMMVGDDDLETQLLRPHDFVDSGDPAVHGQHEAKAGLGQSGERVARDSVAFLETTWQMPGDVGPQLAQHDDRQRGRAESVHVVVAVHADPSTRLDGATNGRARLLDVAEEEGVVPGERTL